MRNFDDCNCLWYKKEAEYFEEALPLGNGSMGAMVWGGAACARIGLNHDTFWTGAPSDGLNGNTGEGYRTAQALAKEGKFLEAQKALAETHCISARVAAYQPVGEVILERAGCEARDYRRALFLREGIAEECFIDRDVRVERETFVSYPDRLLVQHVYSEAPADYTVRLQSPLAISSKTLCGEITMTVEAPLFSPVQIQRDACDRGMTAEHGMHACVHSSVCADGRVESGADGAVFVSGAYHVWIFTSVATSFCGYDQNPVIDGAALLERAMEPHLRMLASGFAFEELRARHIADVTKLYDRMYFSLGDDRCASIPTDERLRRFAGGEGEQDRGLYTLLFHYGRYLTIAGSRAGSEALNLQGIWNDKLDPPWSSNYTTNINLEMNYFGTLAANLPEMTEPLDALIRRISVTGRKTAEALYGARGFVCHHNSDIWAHTVPIKGEPVYAFWPMGSGWLCRHLLEKYDYLGERTYLEEAYPILREAARFYLDILTEVDGYLTVCPATSPENFFLVDHTRVAVAKSTEMNVAILRELFAGVLRAAEVLGLSDDVTDEVRAALPRLMPIRTLSDGRIEEWYFGEGVELPENEPHHRHTSHLYALHPAHEINASTPALREAARKTLAARGDDGTGWSLAWKTCFFARLGDGDHALRLIKRMLKFTQPTREISYHGGGGIYPNLFGAHPPFQIDSNFGYVGAICEMLVQTEGDEVKLLPALPSEWTDGKVRGLRIKGNRLLDMEWHGGKLLCSRIYGAE